MHGGVPLRAGCVAGESLTLCGGGAVVCRQPALVLPYEYVCDELEDGVDEYVGQNDEVALHYRAQSLVENDERGCKKKYGDKSLMLRHSGMHQLVVYVVLVSLEYRVAVLQPRYDDPHHIETGYYEQCVGYQQTVVAVGHDVRIVHGELDEKEPENETQGETSRVAHENLVSLLRLPPYVEEEICREHAHESGYEDGVSVDALMHEAQQEAREREQGESAGEPVDAVDEVHGVVDEHEHEHRERRTHPERELVYAEHAVHVVDVKTGERQQRCGYYLHGELGSRSHSHNVVHYTYDVYERKAYEEHYRPCAYGYLPLSGELVENGYSEDEGYERARQEAYSSKAGNGVLVHFARVGNVVKVLFNAEVDNVRYDDETARGAYYKSRQYQNDAVLH